MKIAIHNSNIGFHPRWVKYCETNNIAYKIVDCYANDIIEQLKDCDALLWHHWQVNSKDILKAKRLLFSLEHSGMIVFPNFKSGWHFDDKIAQKYLLESLGLPLVKSFHFVEKQAALDWVQKTDFPKVFKLTRGAGSANVKLVHSRKDALKLVKKAFSSGHSIFDRFGGLKERYRKYREGKETIWGVFRSVYRILNVPQYAKLLSNERFEVYFQDFIPNNEFDIRIIVIDGKAFAIKRLVRKDDFRASGSGNILYDAHHFDTDLVKNSFDFADKINSNCIGFDFVFDNEKRPLIVEISYGFAIEGYDECVGYWDRQLNFHIGKFDVCGWMVDMAVNEIGLNKYV